MLGMDKKEVDSSRYVVITEDDDCFYLQTIEKAEEKAISLGLEGYGSIVIFEYRKHLTDNGFKTIV